MDQSDGRHVLNAMVAIGGVVQRTLLVDDPDRRFVGRDDDFLHLVQARCDVGIELDELPELLFGKVVIAGDQGLVAGAILRIGVRIAGCGGRGIVTEVKRLAGNEVKLTALSGADQRVVRG